MVILVIRAIVLFLAVSLTGVTLTLFGSFLALVSAMDFEKHSDIFGRVKVSFNSTWLWFLVGLLWAGFFFLGSI